jgi:hypothetical protein
MSFTLTYALLTAYSAAEQGGVPREALPASSSTSAQRYSQIAAMYTAEVAPTRPWRATRFFKCLWIRPTGNCSEGIRKQRRREISSSERETSARSHQHHVRLSDGYARAIIVWIRDSECPASRVDQGMHMHDRTRDGRAGEYGTRADCRGGDGDGESKSQWARGRPRTQFRKMDSPEDQRAKSATGGSASSCRKQCPCLLYLPCRPCHPPAPHKTRQPSTATLGIAKLVAN